MFINQTIRRLFAFMLLVLFTFSITPKRYLHDLFAGHKDMVTKTSTDGQAHISKSAFSCDCNTLVATSPFTDDEDNIVALCPAMYAAFFASFINSLHSTVYSFTELRGPPVVG